MANVGNMPRLTGDSRVALIDESRCIGCTLCIQACPFDAIVGAAKQMHTVIVDLCTGCDLCVAPCPVDCIAMVPSLGRDAPWTRARLDAARERFEQRNRRLARDRAERAAKHAPRKPEGTRVKKTLSSEQKRAIIRAAVERVRARRAAARRSSP